MEELSQRRERRGTLSEEELGDRPYVVCSRNDEYKGNQYPGRCLDYPGEVIGGGGEDLGTGEISR